MLKPRVIANMATAAFPPGGAPGGFGGPPPFGGAPGFPPGGRGGPPGYGR